MNENKIDKENVQDEKKSELKKLVLARIDIMPPNFKLSIGNKGTFNKEQLIEHINRGDETGSCIIDMQVRFIKALTSGRFIEALNKQNE